MFKEITAWLVYRKARATEVRYERGFGWAMTRHFHSLDPKDYIEDCINLSADEHGSTPFIQGARSALEFMLDDEGSPAETIKLDPSKPRTVEDALLLAQERMLSGVLELLTDAKRQLANMSSDPLLILETLARLVRFAESAQVKVYCDDEGVLHYWHRHKNGSLSRITRNIAANELLETIERRNR